MKKACKSIGFSFLFAIVSVNGFSQDTDFELLSQTKKDTSLHFPLDYKIARPRLVYPDWDKDFDVYYHFLTPPLRKTQASLSYTDNGVTSNVTPNSIIPHAQLDTGTLLNDPDKLIGTWRMLKFRSIRFVDSVDLRTITYYRMPDTLLDDHSSDETFAVFTSSNMKLYAREPGETKFKKEMSAKYQVENRRFIMVYKLSRAAAGVSQFGIDENGYLILNYPRVIENIKKGSYFAYYTIIDQYIFMKVK